MAHGIRAIIMLDKHFYKNCQSFLCGIDNLVYIITNK